MRIRASATKSLLLIAFCFGLSFVLSLAVGRFAAAPQQPVTAPAHFAVTAPAQITGAGSSESGGTSASPITSESAGTSETGGAVLGETATSGGGSLTFETDANHFSNGGVLVLNARLQPTIKLTGSGVSGTVKITLYQASRDDLLHYLTYKRSTAPGETWNGAVEKRYQIKPESLPVAGSFDQPVTQTESGAIATDVPLPITGTGIWYLQAVAGQTRAETMVVRSNLAGLIHRGDNQAIFWVQDTAYNVVPDAAIELLNLENSTTQLGTIKTSPDGLVSASVNEALDLALVTKEGDLTVIPVQLANLQYRLSGDTPSGWYYGGFGARQTETTSFIFTDRFLFQPGDVVNFKAIIRQDDDADYRIKQEPVTIALGTYQKAVVEQTGAVSPLGTVDGSLKLPDDIEAGYYNLEVLRGQQPIATAYVQVARYRKPSATIALTTDNLMYLPGQTMTVSVQGTAFLGQPLKNQPVQYKLYQSKASIEGDYQHVKYSQSGAYLENDQHPIQEGTAQLDGSGKAQIRLPVTNTTGERQFWIVVVQYLDTSSIATTSMIQALINPGEFVIQRQNTKDGLVAGTTTALPLLLAKNVAEAKVDGIAVRGKLLHVTYEDGNTIKNVEQDNLTATSDEQGRFTIAVTPPAAASYDLALEARDVQGNLITSSFSFFAAQQAEQGNHEPIFTISADKPSYAVGDTAQLTISTKREVKTAFFSVGRSYSRLYQTVALTDGKATLTVPISEKYQPNVYAMIGSFWGDTWQTALVDLPIKVADKKLTVSIAPDRASYGPGETATIKLTVRDDTGQPVQTDLAFWLFDKALLELHGAYFEGIFNTYWHERWFSAPLNYSYQGVTSSGAEMGGGCFTGETLVAMADGSHRPIDQVLAGDQVATLASPDSDQHVAAKVLGVHRVTVAGYLIINGQLRVTPEHRLYVNGGWKTAGEIVVGDTLWGETGQPVTVRSIEWLRHKAPVYNLSIETYHTYLAGGYYVHNEKGESRSVFKDTAYWNPHVTTDANGQAQVTVVLPDNLTTWVAAAVAASGTTQVGDGQTQFIVTKNIVTTPILPLFLRVGDQVRLGALLQNFTKNKVAFTVEAAFSAGELQHAQQKQAVAADGVAELYWPSSVSQEQAPATFKVRAQGVSDPALVDEVTAKVPVYRYGSFQKSVLQLEDTTQQPLVARPGTDPTRAETTLTVRSQRYPTLAKTLQTMLEQGAGGGPDTQAAGLYAASLLARFGPALGLNYTKPALQQWVAKYEHELANERNAQGVWFKDYQTKRIDPSLTRLVLEGLAQAQTAGFTIDATMLDTALRTVSGAAGWQPSGWNEQVEQQYIFSLFPDRPFNRQTLALVPDADPAFLARAILSNLRREPTTLTKDQARDTLLSRALQTPSQLSWKSELSLLAIPRGGNQPSWLQITIPTSWAVRALQALETDQSLVLKSLDYLDRLSEVVSPEAKATTALAMVDYYTRAGELTTDGTYRVAINDHTIGQGSLSAIRQTPAAYTIDATQLAQQPQLGVIKEGGGKLYSVLSQQEFVTDSDSPAQLHGLTLTRRYLSTKKPGEPVVPGDLVIVQFEVAGLGQGETKVQIEDYLPSGLVAIDESLDNAQLTADAPPTVRQQLTDQGMKLTFSQLFADRATYHYQTRVVSEGVFTAPGATVTLQGDPKIWASTTAQVLTIDGKHALETTTPPRAVPTAEPLPAPYRYLLVGLVVVVSLLVIGGVFYTTRKQSRRASTAAGEATGAGKENQTDAAPPHDLQH